MQPLHGGGGSLAAQWPPKAVVQMGVLGLQAWRGTGDAALAGKFLWGWDGYRTGDGQGLELGRPEAKEDNEARHG